MRKYLDLEQNEVKLFLPTISHYMSSAEFDTKNSEREVKFCIAHSENGEPVNGRQVSLVGLLVAVVGLEMGVPHFIDLQTDTTQTEQVCQVLSGWESTPHYRQLFCLQETRDQHGQPDRHPLQDGRHPPGEH